MFTTIYDLIGGEFTEYDTVTASVINTEALNDVVIADDFRLMFELPQRTFRIGLIVHEGEDLLEVAQRAIKRVYSRLK